MSTQDSLDELLKLIIEILDNEIRAIQAAQPLDKLNAAKLIDYATTIVTIKKDWRIDEKDKSPGKLKDDKLDAAIQAEIDKLLGK